MGRQQWEPAPHCSLPGLPCPGELCSPPAAGAGGARGSGKELSSPCPSLPACWQGLGKMLFPKCVEWVGLSPRVSISHAPPLPPFSLVWCPAPGSHSPWGALLRAVTVTWRSTNVWAQLHSSCSMSAPSPGCDWVLDLKR